VILEHSVLGLHTCLVPVLLSSPLLSCIPCLGSALQYILCACSVHSFPVCITSTSILASLRCTCFDIARQILSTPCRHSGQTPTVHVGHYGQPTVTVAMYTDTKAKFYCYLPIQYRSIWHTKPLTAVKPSCSWISASATMASSRLDPRLPPGHWQLPLLYL
jgi:hypothetical protein